MTASHFTDDRACSASIRIGLIELYATQDGRLFGPRLKDLYCVVRLPSRAIDLLAAILRAHGFANVAAYNPLYNSHGGRFHPEELEELARMDVVGISSITRTQPQSYELASRLKEMNPRIRIVFGGPHVTALPEEALEYGDIAVLHEGDATIVELMERLAEDLEDPDLDDVKGIAYRDRHGRICRTPPRPFLTGEELSALPLPEIPKEVCRRIDYSVIVTSRGCPFACDFCAVIHQFGSQYRFLDVDRSIELIEHTVRQTGKPIFFGDDNFNARPSRTRALLERILEKGIRMPPWHVQVRVEAAEDPDLLSMMKRAGCRTVYVGFESINDKTLAAFNKKSSLEKNEAAIRRFHEAGLSVHGMFVLGSDEDTVETVRDTVRFAKKLKIDTAQFFALTTIPGSKLMQRYADQGKIITTDWHVYDGHHVVIRPEKMAPHVLQAELVKAHLDFYSLREALRYLFGSHDRLGNASIRLSGNILTRQIRRSSRSYQKKLESLDQWNAQAEGLYSRLRKRWEAMSHEVGQEVIRRAEPVRASLEELARTLTSGMDSVSTEFLPYCQRRAALILEKARSQLKVDDLKADLLGLLEPREPAEATS